MSKKKSVTPTDSVAVFIASSDNTLDVFERVFPSFQKFWPDCPFPLYAGFNTARPKGCKPVHAGVAGWRGELSAQIAQVPAEYVLLFLDDFLLLKTVDTARLQSLCDQAIDRDINYLRMVQRSRALLPGWLHALSNLLTKDDIEPVPTFIPYYSSLQVALWKKSHLIDNLEAPGSIWEFEHQRLAGANHFCLRSDPPIDYIHVVEKGQWQPAARDLFAERGISFDPGDRASRPAGDRWVIFKDKWKFLLIGYTWVRLKRLWRERGKES